MGVSEKIVSGLFGEGGLLRVRALMALTMTGAAIYFAAIGLLPIMVFVAAWTSAMGVYIGVRAVEGRDSS